MGDSNRPLDGWSKNCVRGFESDADCLFARSGRLLSGRDGMGGRAGGAGANAGRSFAPGSLFELIAIRQSELVLQGRQQMQQFALVLHGMRLMSELRLRGALKGSDSQRLEFVAAGEMTRRHFSS